MNNFRGIFFSASVRFNYIALFADTLDLTNHNPHYKF